MHKITAMDIFYALSAPTRRSIVELLAVEGQLTSTAIALKFPWSPPAISQHLQVLRKTGLVHMEKHGQERIYEIDPIALKQLENWSMHMASQWNDRLDKSEAAGFYKARQKILVKAKK